MLCVGLHLNIINLVKVEIVAFFASLDMSRLHCCQHYKQFSFIKLSFGSIGMERVLSELCYTGTILLRNDKKMTIS